MKRTPLPPRTKYPPRSTKRIRSRKKDPAKRRFAKHRCQEYLDWLKTEACCITGARGGQWVKTYTPEGDFCDLVWVIVDPAHLDKARSLGGDDLWNALPLARHLHEEQTRIRWPAFAKKYGIDRQAIAREHTERWLATPDGKRWLAEHPEKAEASRG